LGLTTDVIVINGGSSSGKSTLVAYLQKTLPGLWMALGIDTLVGSLPPRMTGGESGIQLQDDGQIVIGADFTRLETAWMHGVAAMARAGAKIIVDDGFLSGPPAQRRWRDALTGLEVVWVGLHCAPAAAAKRETAR
jgi:chloramphenicol 3-O phosphotransferase